MRDDARWHLDLLASIETLRQPDRTQSQVSARLPRRDVELNEELFGRIVQAGPSARARVPRDAGQAAARPLRKWNPNPSQTRASAPPRVKQILLVDPNVRGVSAAAAALRPTADVEVCDTFQNARARLLRQPPDLLITNLRLEAYNGLHLVYLAAAARTRCVVFSTDADLGLAREVQETGAFFELSPRLPQVLESYANATLPHRDRRDITRRDQRPFGGGRRCTDQ